MQIAFFDTKPYDKPSFERLGSEQGMTFKFFETKLNEDTASLAAGCDVLIGGDLGHHDGIDAVAEGVSLINAGHYGLEHVFIDAAADYLESRFGGEITVVRAPVVFPEELV